MSREDYITVMFNWITYEMGMYTPIIDKAVCSKALNSMYTGEHEDFLLHMRNSMDTYFKLHNVQPEE